MAMYAEPIDVCWGRDNSVENIDLGLCDRFTAKRSCRNGRYNKWIEADLEGTQYSSPSREKPV